MSFKRVNQRTCTGVPNFAGSIVASSDKLISVFVETAVGQRQYMTLQFFDQHKFLFSLFLDLFHQFFINLVLLLMIPLI